MVDVDKEFRAKIIKFHSSEVEKYLLKPVECSLRTKINSTLKLFRIRQNRCLVGSVEYFYFKKKKKTKTINITTLGMFDWQSKINKLY